MKGRTVLAPAFALTLAACGGEAPAPAPPTVLPPPPVRPAAVAAAVVTPAEDDTLPPVPYEAKGRRDPFQVIEVTTGATRGLTVSSTKLTGIVQSQRGTYALLEAADGIGYILRAGDTLGDGRLIEIGADSAVFNVVSRPGAPPTRMTLRLGTDS